MATDSTAPEQAPEPTKPKPEKTARPQPSTESIEEAVYTEFAEDQGQRRLWLRTRNDRIAVNLDVTTVLLSALGFPPPPTGDSAIPNTFDPDGVDEGTARVLRKTLKVVLADIERQIEAGASLEGGR